MGYQAARTARCLTRRLGWARGGCPSPADVAAVFAACPERVMPSASRSLLPAMARVARRCGWGYRSVVAAAGVA
jgi:hypothetical protein